MRAVSRKRAAVNRQRAKLAADYPDEPCRIGTPVCTGWAEHFHELVGRAQGGSLVDRRNLVPADDACNGWIEDNPVVSQLKGWKVPVWEAEPGVGGLVPVLPSRLAIAWEEVA